MGRTGCSHPQFNVHDWLHERRFLEFSCCRLGVRPCTWSFVGNAKCWRRHFSGCITSEWHALEWSLLRKLGPIHSPLRSWQEHVLSIACALFLWGMATTILKRRGRAWRPGLDAFTTVGSLLATYWMLQFVHANWLYWMVVNSAAIVLYSSRKMTWTVGLFVLYTLLAIEGWFDFFP